MGDFSAMMAPPEQSVIPPPLDDDDDDVAWALQTAQVQWKRGSKADAVVWLRRAVESAMSSGKVARAMQLNAYIAKVEEQLVESVFSGSSPPPSPTSDSLIGIVPAPSAIDVDALLGVNRQPSGGDIDALLGTPPEAPRQSIDVEFEDPDPGQDDVGPTSQFVRSLLKQEPPPVAAAPLDDLFPPEPSATERSPPKSTEPAMPPLRRVKPPPPPRKRGAGGSAKPMAPLPPPTGLKRSSRARARAEAPPIHVPPPVADEADTVVPDVPRTLPLEEPLASAPVRRQPTSFPPPEAESPHSS